MLAVASASLYSTFVAFLVFRSTQTRRGTSLSSVDQLRDDPVQQHVIEPGNVYFMHMILMDSENNLAMNLGETYLVTETGNERLGKQKLDLVVL